MREVKDGVSADPDYIGGRSFCLISSPGLHPLTRKQALAWAESKEFDADKVESIFGTIAEAGEKTGYAAAASEGAEVLHRSAAGAAEQSSNASVMRWVESCLNDTTGRDGLIIRKALAYAIVAIERLPDEWREESAKEDMRMLFEAMTPSQFERDNYIAGARSHIERRGIAIEEGKLVVAPRDSDTVVPLK